MWQGLGRFGWFRLGRAWLGGVCLYALGMPSTTVVLDQFCASCAKVGKTRVPRSLPGDVVICCLCGDVSALSADLEPVGLTLAQWDELDLLEV